MAFVSLPLVRALNQWQGVRIERRRLKRLAQKVVNRLLDMVFEAWLSLLPDPDAQRKSLRVAARFVNRKLVRIFDAWKSVIEAR